ncbi:MAG: 3-hydroxyacyl-ACP dehydratase FabZ [Alphaproteobacteria bacterium]|nr:3-hydroxyacyl-ACP dehydratase FabZ [Alphaproteobacteria bacterium]
MTESSGTTALASADIRRIMELLPHRPPFLMIDRVIDIVPSVSATGIKNVTFNEPQFAGHFPGMPVMPGVLLIEAMAQTAGAMVVHSLDITTDGKVVYFMTIDKARFRVPVVPGDTVMLPVKAIRRRGPVWRFQGEARVGDRLCAEAEFSAMIMDANAKSPPVSDE